MIKYKCICPHCNQTHTLPDKTLNDFYPYCSNQCSIAAMNGDDRFAELWRLHRITFRMLLEEMVINPNMLHAESLSLGLAIENKIVGDEIDRKINDLNSQLEFFKFSIKKI